MYTFVTFFLKTFLYHTGFVYIRYISLDGFFLCICIVYVRFFFFFFFFFFRARDLLIFLNTGLVYIGSYVFALYIFVTHIERCI